MSCLSHTEREFKNGAVTYNKSQSCLIFLGAQNLKNGFNKNEKLNRSLIDSIALARLALGESKILFKKYEKIS